MRCLVMGIILILTGLGTVEAAAPDTLWTRVYGGTQGDWAWAVDETTDSGYVVAGYIRSEDYPFLSDIFVVKLNRDGSEAWSYMYGTDSTDDFGVGVREVDGGNLIVVGYGGGPYGIEGSNYYMLKLNSGGGLSWDANFDWENTTNYGYDGCQIEDGGFILVGQTYYSSTVQGGLGWGPVIFKADSLGEKVNEMVIDRAGTQSLNRVSPTADGGAIAIGAAGRLWVVKITPSGDTAWARTYGGTGDGWSIAQLADDTYAAFGVRGYNPPEDDDFLLVRIDTDGDSLWTRRYPNPADNDAYSLDLTSDGGFVMVGDSHRNGTDATDVYIVRADASGDTLWTMMVGGDRADRGYSVKQTADGGYIIAGVTESFGQGSTDLYIVKLGPDHITDVASGEPALPAAIQLSINYPNPFNPNTTIAYSLERRAHVVLEIVNILGQHVRTLVDEIKPAGSYVVAWDGKDDQGRVASAGVYLYRLQTEGTVQAKKMLLLK